MHAAVDQQYRDLLDVLLVQLFVIQNREFIERDRRSGCDAIEFGDHPGHNIPRLVAQMTSRLANEGETQTGHEDQPNTRRLAWGRADLRDAGQALSVCARL
jgi:hypothetical protein